jgi:hypothetical protein
VEGAQAIILSLHTVAKAKIRASPVIIIGSLTLIAVRGRHRQHSSPEYRRLAAAMNASDD